MRWILSKVIDLYLDLKEAVCQAKLERGNRRRFEAARRNGWSGYIYYKGKDGWFIAPSTAYPPYSSDLKELPYEAPNGCGELDRFLLEHTEH